MSFFIHVNSYDFKFNRNLKNYENFAARKKRLVIRYFLTLFIDNCYYAQITETTQLPASLDFHCMSPTQQIDYKELCVSKMITSIEAPYLQYSTLLVKYKGNMSSTTTRDYRGLPILAIIMSMLRMIFVKQRCMVRTPYLFHLSIECSSFYVVGPIKHQSGAHKLNTA